MAAHPMQPIEKDSDDVYRFKPNKIVQFLLDWASGRGMSMNDLAMIPFDREDREQFAQLIGYSVCGFSDLQYASDDAVARAEGMEAEMKKRRDDSLQSR